MKDNVITGIEKITIRGFVHMENKDISRIPTQILKANVPKHGEISFRLTSRLRMFLKKARAKVTKRNGRV